VTGSSEKVTASRARGASSGETVTVVKLGGGIARELGDEALRSTCRALAAAARRYPLVVVPGGGELADQVREYDRRFALTADCAHRMALAAMEQYGVLLGQLIPGALLCADPHLAAQCAGRGRVAVLCSFAATLADAQLPRSWAVTSDSIALWVAQAVAARRAVLLKAVDGLYRSWPARDEPAPLLTAEELARLQRQGGCGGVDRYLPTLLRYSGVETWVIGGGRPKRLEELLENGSTIGTRLLGHSAGGLR